MRENVILEAGRMPTCAICGKVVEQVTTDHIPPKNLFGTKPGNLITVPACFNCNAGSSADDEYFRLIASEVDTANHPDAKRANEAIVRSMERPQASGYREGLRKSIYPIEVAEGGSTEVKPFIGLDVNRLDRTVAKIVKGLFYHTKGYPIPVNYKVEAANLDLFMKKPSSVEMAKLIVNYLLPKCSWIKPTVIGNDVFSYQICFDEDDPNTVFMLMVFYGRWRYFGLVYEPSS
jgi:hypothetical protein